MMKRFRRCERVFFVSASFRWRNACPRLEDELSRFVLGVAGGGALGGG
jgi:hypothetical protein